MSSVNKNFTIADVTVAASRQDRHVEPEIVLYDPRPDQRDTYFCGRTTLLELRAAIDFALNEDNKA